EVAPDKVVLASCMLQFGLSRSGPEGVPDQVSTLAAADFLADVVLAEANDLFIEGRCRPGDRAIHAHPAALQIAYLEAALRDELLTVVILLEHRDLAGFGVHLLDHGGVPGIDTTAACLINELGVAKLHHIAGFDRPGISQFHHGLLSLGLQRIDVPAPD